MNISDLPESTDVLIVGAGPTGLMLASWLARYGIRALVIDRKAGPTRESRALVVQARSMEVYDQLGVGAAVLAQGRPVPGLNVWLGEERVAHLDIEHIGGGRTPHPYFFALEQSHNEELLYAHLQELGGAVHWQHQLERLSHDESGATALISGPDGATHTVRAEYVCGADGAHSLVRHSMDMPFVGSTNALRFYVADAVATGALTEGEINLKVDAETLIFAFPIVGKDHFRLLGIAPEPRQPDGTIGFADVRDQSERLGIQVAEVRWFSSYKVNHRVVEHFRQGRLFLLGDAAHVHSPLGGQGMNTGLMDAHNLAWKLAAVLRGAAGTRLLDSYEAERRPFARALVRNTDRLFDIIVNPSSAWKRLRSRLLPALLGLLAGDTPAADSKASAGDASPSLAQSTLFGLMAQLRMSYRDSPLSWGQAGQIHGGDRLPYVSLGAASNFDALKAARLQLHVYGAAEQALREWAAQMPEPELCEFPFTHEAAAAGLQKNALYLVRPDGYIGAALSHFDPARLEEQLELRWAWPLHYSAALV